MGGRLNPINRHYFRLENIGIEVLAFLYCGLEPTFAFLYGVGAPILHGVLFAEEHNGEVAPNLCIAAAKLAIGSEALIVGCLVHVDRVHG